MPSPAASLALASLAAALASGPSAPARETARLQPRVVARAASAAELRRAPFQGPVAATVTRIIDGDTFEARVRVWFGTEITTLVRIRGFDAAEKKARCATEAGLAEQAGALLADYLSTGPVELNDIALDKYGGRVLATVTVGDGAAPAAPREDIAALMLATGIVRPYAGGRRQSWCGLSADAR